MKMPGVSLIAVARPMPMPPSRLPPRDQQQQVGRDQEQQQHVDLAEDERLAQRLEGRDAGRARCRARTTDSSPGATTGSTSQVRMTSRVATTFSVTLITIAACHGDDRHRQHQQRGERRIGEAVRAVPGSRKS